MFHVSKTKKEMEKPEVEEKMSKAIYRGDLSTISSLVGAYGLNYSDEWCEGFALLTLALKLPRKVKYERVATLLLSKGAKVNITNSTTPTPLHFATSENHVGIVKRLLEVGAMVNATNELGETPLHKAVLNQNEGTVTCIRSKKSSLNFNKEIIDLLLRSDADVNAIDNYGGTPLLYAIRYRSPKCVGMLIKYCANINYKTTVGNDEMKGFTPLQYAVRMNRTKIVELLLPYETVSIPLNLAVQGNFLPMARFLISRGANVNAYDEAGKTPISYICLEGRSGFYKESASFQMFKLLVENGGKPEDNPGLLPFAFKYDNMEAIKVILKHDDVNVNVKDSSGLSALHYAVFRHSKRDQKSSQAAVTLLLQKNADVNCKTNTDVGVLHIAAMLDPYPRHVLFFKDLLTYNADVNISCKTVTPLHLCVFKSNLKFFKTLLIYGADVNAKLDDGKTALHLVALVNHRALDAYNKFKRALECFGELGPASFSLIIGNRYYNDSRMVQALVEFGADLNSKDADGKTSLHYAAENVYKGYELMRILSKHGADHMSRDKYSKTAIHYAAEMTLKRVAVLVEFGANINSQDIHGQTPLHTIVAKKRSNMVRGLLKLGSDINIVNNDNQTPLELALDAYKDLSSTTVDILKKHVVKLHAADLNISSRNLTALSDIFDDSDYAYLELCLCELDLIENTYIDETGVSYYDILKSDRGKLEELAKNDLLVQKLEEEFAYMFPIYAPDLKLKVFYLKQAHLRESLLEKSAEIFRIYIADLPDLCVNEVLGYLSNRNLEYLVRVRYPLKDSSKTYYFNCEGYFSNNYPW